MVKNIRNGEEVKMLTYIKILSKKLGMSIKELINSSTTGPNNTRGTWVYPMLATYISQWISPKFAIEVSLWIEEWKQLNNNRLRYIKEINNLECIYNDNKEKQIQIRLCKELNGIREVKTVFVYIDILTSTEIIEIKDGSKWKHGIGQLIVYSEEYPTHKKRLHLFGVDYNESICKICEKNNIVVTYE